MATPLNVINTYCLAQTRMNKKEMRKWLKEGVGVSEEYDFDQFDHITDAEATVGLAAKRCYKSFEVGLNPNVTRIRKDWSLYLENILKVGHGSTLEHATFTFAIEGCTRVFTAEMNRHRAGCAISEASMRYIRFEDIPYWLPFSIRPDENDTPELESKKSASRKLFFKAFEEAQENYKTLLDIWEDDLKPESKFHNKKQITSMMRRIVPIGVSTGVVYTWNIRALRHILEMRCSPAAEEEICYVATKILKEMIESLDEKKLFGDFYQDEQGFWLPEYKKV